MSIDPNQLRELQLALADRLYIQVASWNLYLGDAGLAEALAIECSVRFSEGAREAARKGLDSVVVPLGGGRVSLSLGQLMPKAQLEDLEEILDLYC